MIAAQKYASTQNETASRERLMVLLLEAALRHVRAGAAALEGKRRTTAMLPLKKATDIVNELMTTLNRPVAPEMVDRLTELYAFICARLLAAQATGEAGPAREAERVLAPIVEGFTGAVASLQQPPPPDAAR